MNVKTRFGSFSALRGAPRELWLALGIKLLEGYALFAVTFTAFRYMTGDLGMSYEEAAWISGLLFNLVGIYSAVTGVVSDMLGVKRGLITTVLLLLAGRVLITFTPGGSWLFYAGIMVALPLGYAFGIPTFGTALHRFTRKENKAFAFSMFHATLNAGAVMAGVFMDIAVTSWPNGITLEFAGLSANFSSYRVIFASTIIVTLLMLGLTMFVRDIRVTETGDVEKVQPRVFTSDVTIWRRILDELRRIGNVFKESRFWRFLLCVLVLIGVRAVISPHLSATFPAYLENMFGRDAPFGKITAINPLVVAIAATLMVPLVNRLGTYRSILVGAIITASAVLFLAWDTAYWTAITFVVLASIGDALWFPRLFQYATSVAPEGYTGTYISAVGIPMFLAKMGMSGLAGYMLAVYCPAGAAVRNPELMWWLIGLMAFASVGLFYVLRRVIRIDEKE